MDAWIATKKFYRDNFGVDDTLILEYIAVHDILELACRGVSNSEIAVRFDFDVGYVSKAVSDFLDYSGNPITLDADMRELYQRYKYNRYVFCTNARQYDKVTEERTLKKIYDINCVLDDIERKIDKYYANAN